MLAEVARTAVEIAIATSPVAVQYTHVATANVVEIARCGFGELQVSAEGLDGQMIRVTHIDGNDLIVWPDDLADSEGTKLTPADDDTVVVTLPSGTVINFIVAPLDNERCWRWTDRFRTARRIHMIET